MTALCCVQKKGKDADPYLPGRVQIPSAAGKVVQLSAGESGVSAVLQTTLLTLSTLSTTLSTVDDAVDDAVAATVHRDRHRAAAADLDCQQCIART